MATNIPSFISTKSRSSSTLLNLLPSSLQFTSSRFATPPRSLFSTMSSNPSQSSNKSRLLKDPHAQRIHAELNSGPDVWSLFNPIVLPKALSLGQGFMPWSPAKFALESFHDQLDVPIMNQYAHPKGRPRLRKAISDFYSPEFRKPDGNGEDLSRFKDGGSLPKIREDQGRELDPETEIQITSGANGGIYASMTALLNPGDEVIVFEPYFDQYEAEITFMGGIPVYIPFIPPSSNSDPSKPVGADEWKLDWDLIEKRLKESNGKIKAIITNTPQNPIGKVFSEDELARLSSICIKYDLLVISDEVYDCLVFDDKKHLRIAAFEGMWDRTITIGSAGKSFACTGWRIGWAIGPSHLIKPVLAAHTRIVFSTNSPAAESVASALEQSKTNGFFKSQVEDYKSLRSLLSNILIDLKIPHTFPHGAYFILADFSKLKIPKDFEFPEGIEKKGKGFKNAWFVAVEAGVVGIPASAFYSEENAEIGQDFIRFSFCKPKEEIEQAGERLKKILPYLE